MDKSEFYLNKNRAVILTAIRSEYLAVREHLVDLKEVKHPEGTIYEKGQFVSNDGGSWTVSVVEIGAGNPGAALETERAIRFFNPSVVLFVGVAGGVKDVKLCDVVAATKVFGYESGKSEQSFKSRPSVGETSYSMVQRALVEARKENWLKRIRNLASGISPLVYVAPIAAGEKVVASKRSDTWKFIRANYSDAVAVEMEGRGFLQAAYANHKVSALIIRGISDLISGKRRADTAGYQDIAAQVASAFAFEVLASFGISAQEEIGTYYLVFSAKLSEFDKTRIEALFDHVKSLSKDGRLTLSKVEEGDEGE